MTSALAERVFIQNDSARTIMMNDVTLYVVRTAI